MEQHFDALQQYWNNQHTKKLTHKTQIVLFLNYWKMKKHLKQWDYPTHIFSSPIKETIIQNHLLTLIGKIKTNSWTLTYAQTLLLLWRYQLRASFDHFKTFSQLKRQTGPIWKVNHQLLWLQVSSVVASVH